MLLILQVGEMSDLIVRYVQHPEISIILKPRDLGQGIVGDVELFKVT